ncbi:MAG TPA: dephospho-CoA kinase [Limnobacter sp.]|nr:dephospho-CoA kinase [Limnobacter sp.]
MNTELKKPSEMIVGLTGGIGSGKTAVSDRLKALGATIVDTDQIAHSLTQAGGLAMDEIRQAFGEAAVNSDGSMNRDHVRSLVFADPQQRTVLEKILHPLIRKLVQAQLDSGAALYFVLVVPLLFEKGGWKDWMDEIVVVDCPVEQQVQRVMQRNGWPESQVQAVISSQADRSTRLAGATLVIENTGDLPELLSKIDLLHQKLIKKVQK